MARDVLHHRRRTGAQALAHLGVAVQVDLRFLSVRRVARRDHHRRARGVVEQQARPRDVQHLRQPPRHVVEQRVHVRRLGVARGQLQQHVQVGLLLARLEPPGHGAPGPSAAASPARPRAWPMPRSESAGTPAAERRRSTEASTSASTDCGAARGPATGGPPRPRGGQIDQDVARPRSAGPGPAARRRFRGGLRSPGRARRSCPAGAPGPNETPSTPREC